jgi:beta-galactosidase
MATTSDTIQKVIGKSKIEPVEMLEINNPVLWSDKSPVMYRSVSELYTLSNDGIQYLSDRITTPFGIRKIEINAVTGFILNDEPLLLKGGCMHHDNGPLGAAAYDRAEERRVELMKKSGFNAIRCAHNPPSPAFLDACDRLGMLVIDEAFDMWREQKNPEDYHLYFGDWWQEDVESMVYRDRNHPSVVLWSIGNEIPESGKPEGAELAEKIAGYVKNLDPSRMITSAVNNIGLNKDLYFNAMDVCGYNYAVNNYITDHNRLPERIIVSTESFPLEAWDYWMAAKDYPWVIGDFVWTGFDYLGEASIGWLGYPHEGSFYPWSHAFCGDIDICGFKRPQSYYRDILWENGKQVSIFVEPPVPSFPLNPHKAIWSKWEWEDRVASWNWTGFEDKKLKVEVYSSCQEVELFLNQQSLGRKPVNRENRWIAGWEVPYKQGELTAKGYEDTTEIASSILRTAYEPKKIRLISDRTSINADGQDLCFITVELIDSLGVRNPEASNLIQFEVEGPGSIIATGSSNPMSTESFQQPMRKAYHGRCLVIIKAGRKERKIKLRASSEGLEPAEIIINTHPGGKKSL